MSNLNRKYSELLEEKRQIEEIQNALKKEVEKEIRKIFDGFSVDYIYKITKISQEKREIIFHLNEQIKTFIRAEVQAVPGTKSDFIDLVREVQNLKLDCRVQLPMIYEGSVDYIVTDENKIILKDGYAPSDISIDAYSILVYSDMRFWTPIMSQEEIDRIGKVAELQNNRVLKIEQWIKDGYSNNELIWKEKWKYVNLVPEFEGEYTESD